MPSSGKGRFLGAGKIRLGQLLLRPDLIAGDQASPVAFDWMLGNTPPHVTCIPYNWLVQPLRFRPDKPINVADVSNASGATARTVNTTSTAEYGEFPAPSGLQLDTQTPPDLANLGAHLVGFYANPRMRCPALTFDLLQHTDTERWLILAREVGDRIRLTGTPATWPDGATSLLIEGVEHTVGIDQRQVVWNTSPIVGSAAGTPGPWFRADASATDGTDILAF